MCDQNSIVRLKVGRHEPKAIFWGQTGCQGIRVDLRPGTYNNLPSDMINGGYVAHWQGVSGMWVPPTYRLKAYSGTNLSGTNGTFQPGLHKDLNNPQTTALRNNQIQSIKFERIRRWDEHLVNCCSGKVANGATPDVCGPYWGKGKDKGSECDSIVGDFCSYRPNDKRCACYSRPSYDPKETSEMAAVRASPICYDQNCNIYGYIPTTLKSRECPPVTVCYSNAGPDGTLSDKVKQVNCNKKGAADVTKPTLPQPGGSNSGTLGGPSATTKPGAGGSSQIADIPAGDQPLQERILNSYTFILGLILIILVSILYASSDPVYPIPQYIHYPN